MQYDLNLGANGSQRIEVQGRFYKYASGTGKIRVRTSKGAFIDLMPGQGVYADTFSSLTISDRSGAANTGVLLAGDYDFRDDTVTGSVSISGGVMDIYDAKKVSSLLSKSFIAAAGNPLVGGDALNVWAVFLKNPAGSGKKVIINKASITQGGDTLYGYIVSEGSYIFSAALAAAANKYAGGVASVARRGIEALPRTSIAALGLSAIKVTSTQYAQVPFQFTEPIVLPPGFALAFISDTDVANSRYGISATFEFTEEV